MREADSTLDHDLQVRNRWANENDLAIWDNRSVYRKTTTCQILRRVY
jgi:alpha-ketoglutarate-dependent taurine dioxygenase